MKKVALSFIQSTFFARLLYEKIFRRTILPPTFQPKMDFLKFLKSCKKLIEFISALLTIGILAHQFLCPLLFQVNPPPPIYFDGNQIIFIFQKESNAKEVEEVGYH